MKRCLLCVIFFFIFSQTVSADLPEIATSEEIAIAISKVGDFIVVFAKSYGRKADDAFSMIMDLETGKPASFVFTSPRTGGQSVYKILDSGIVERQGSWLKGEPIPTPKEWVNLQLIYNNKNKTLSVSDSSKTALRLIDDEYKSAGPLRDPLAPIKKANIKNIEGALDIISDPAKLKDAENIIQETSEAIGKIKKTPTPNQLKISRVGKGFFYGLVYTVGLTLFENDHTQRATEGSRAKIKAMEERKIKASEEGYLRYDVYVPVKIGDGTILGGNKTVRRYTKNELQRFLEENGIPFNPNYNENNFNRLYTIIYNYNSPDGRFILREKY